MSEQPKFIPGMVRFEEADELRAAIEAIEEPGPTPAPIEPNTEALRAAEALADRYDIPVTVAHAGDLEDIARALDAFAVECVDAEREACAKVAESLAETFTLGRRTSAHDAVPWIAERIRARGTTGGDGR